MINRLILLRQKLIINKLANRPHSWDEIASMLENHFEYDGYDLSISQRQFQRQIKDIDKLWRISIKYNRTKNHYYIDNDAQEGMIYREALDIFTLMDLDNQNSQYIIFEKRRPAGTENIPTILKAIKNEKIINFSYKKFYENYEEQRKVKPLFVKESNNRWYIVGYDLKKLELRVFGIDRIQEITLGKNFKVPLEIEEIQKLFDHCFGIILPKKNDFLEEVVLSYTGFQGQYIKTMPLHHTQKIVKENDDEIRIKIHIYVTQDFIMEILSAGASVSVISPRSLRDRITTEYKKALRNEIF
ncbi:helix-turn-helix transcriptional regulator [Sphingobacterium lactis]|uniref:helix-turn-helix transcriptional regulator n=1 Tax=Sphingobacterium lactis TaxID=797291 RepID=UPI003DA42DF6